MGTPLPRRVATLSQLRAAVQSAIGPQGDGLGMDLSQAAERLCMESPALRGQGGTGGGSG